MSGIQEDNYANSEKSLYHNVIFAQQCVVGQLFLLHQRCVSCTFNLHSLFTFFFLYRFRIRLLGTL
jgi:hypothetical protein